MLSILFDMSPFLAIPDHCKHLISLLCGDVDIDESVILAVHVLARDEVYARMVQIAELVDSVRLFDRLFSSFVQFPNLLPLLVFFAIKLHELPKLATLFSAISVTFYPMLRPNRFWFVFPVIALFNSPDDATTSALCGFVARLLNSGIELPAITAFMKLLKYTTGQADSSITATFLEAVRLHTDKQEGFAEICFDDAFFHFQDFCWHPRVLDAVHAAGIAHDIAAPRPLRICATLSDADALALLAHIDPTAIPVSFCFRIDPALPRGGSTWTDGQVASLALSALDEDAPLRDIFWFFKDPRSLAPERAEVIAVHLDAFIQRRLEEFRTQTTKMLEDLVQQLRDYVKFHGFPEDGNDFAEIARERTDREFARLTAPIAGARGELKQDSRTCAAFSPMKQKRAGARRRAREAVGVGAAIAEFACVRVKKGGEARGSFALTRECFVVDGVAFALGSIRDILTRSWGIR
jgi:hypothetical protein